MNKISGSKSYIYLLCYYIVLVPSLIMWLCLTKLSDANLLQILKADVRDKVNVFIPVLHQNLVVLTKTQVRQPVCQIGLKHTGTHKHGHNVKRLVHRLQDTE